MNTLSKPALWALSAVLALGCSQQTVREPSVAQQRHPNSDQKSGATLAEEEPQLTPASLTLSAPEQLVRSRCEREQQCSRMGAYNAFTSGSNCLSRLQNDWHEELSARQCPGGVNEPRLRRCLDFLRVEDCQERFDRQTLENECRPDQICLNEPPPP